MFIMSPIWRLAPVARIFRHSSCLSYVIDTKPGNLYGVLKRLTNQAAGLRLIGYQAKSLLVLGAGTADKKRPTQ
jgi:hypothetical protein